MESEANDEGIDERESKMRDECAEEDDIFKVLQSAPFKK